MRTKIFSALALFAVVMGVNASLKSSNPTEDVSLSDLVDLSNANAECVGKDLLNNGRCNDFTKRCVLNPFPEEQDCDFYSN